MFIKEPLAFSHLTMNALRYNGANPNLLGHWFQGYVVWYATHNIVINNNKKKVINNASIARASQVLVF